MLWPLGIMLFCNWLFITTGTGTGTVSTRRPDFVNIGAILSFKSSIGKVAKVALETAVEDVNSNSAVLNGTKLNLTMQDTKLSSGFLGIVEALRFMDNDTVAIIGPQHSVMAHVISHIANELQVPLLSFAATDPTLNSLQFPYFVRTTQSDGFQMAAVADVVGYYEWRDVIAIYIDDDHGRNGVSALGDMLAEKRCKISYKAPMSPKLSRDEIISTLWKVTLMESRVIVLHIYATWGLDVLDVAREIGMMRSGYVWIATDWLSTVLDTESSPYSAAMDSIQGVLTLRMYVPDSKPKRKLLSRWKNLTASNTENSRFGLNTYGMYAYDTVWLLAHSLDGFLNQGGNISFSNDRSLTEFHGGRLQFDAMSIFDGGSLLRSSILGVNITGVTGKLKFNSEGDLFHPAYEVINVIGTGIRTIGYWSNSSGLSVLPPDKYNAQPNSTSSSKQQLYGVIWPGQTTQKPRGWAFSSNGRQLRVGVPNRISYREFVSRIENSDSYGGFCIDVFNAAREELPYPVPYKFVPFGDIAHKNQIISDMLHMITYGALDAVVGDITITTSRTKMVDFTQPYIESGLVVVAPLRKLNSSAWAFLRPFTPMMWCATGVFFLIVGAVVWILERRTNDEFRGPPRKQLDTIIWFSFSTLFFTHRESIASSLGRFVLLIWLFVVLILNSSYTASLTSIMTVEQLSSPVKGIESLVTSSDPIGFQRGSFAENYLTHELNIHESRLVPFSSLGEYEKALRDGPSKGGVAAVVDEREYMELFLSTRCEFAIVGQEFTKMGWGFAFPRDSQLAIDMSMAILTLSEKGILQRLHKKWLARSACNSEGTKQDIDRLELKSFWGLFLLCAFVCILSLLFYLIKMIREYKRHSGQINPGQFGHLRSFLSFVKEKEDNHQEEEARKGEPKSSRPLER